MSNQERRRCAVVCERCQARCNSPKKQYITDEDIQKIKENSAEIYVSSQGEIYKSEKCIGACVAIDRAALYIIQGKLVDETFVAESVYQIKPTFIAYMGAIEYYQEHETFEGYVDAMPVPNDPRFKDTLMIPKEGVNVQFVIIQPMVIDEAVA